MSLLRACLGLILGVCTLCASVHGVVSEAQGAPPRAEEELEERIAVLELTNVAGLKPEEVRYLSDLVRRLASSALAQQFLIMTKENVTRLLPPDVSLEDCGKTECAVDLGKLLQASFVITGEVIRFGGQLRVTLKLHDTRSAAFLGSEVASGREVTDLESGIQEAGGRLLRRLMGGGTQQKSAQTRRKKIGGGATQAIGSSRERLIVRFYSQPSGAVVTVDGAQRCAEGQTRCEVELTEGEHQVRMSKTDYFERSESVSLSRSRDELTWRLDPNFATLEVTPSPSSLSYTINGRHHQGVHKQRIKPGEPYRVISDDRCFERSGEEVQAGAVGEALKVRLSPKRLYATLDVSARDPDGRPLRAEVYIDGDYVGSTPISPRVSVCARTLRLSHSEQGEREVSLSLRAGEVAREVVTLNDSAGARAKRRRMWAWTSASLALLSVGASVYGYQLAGEAEAEFPSTQDNPERYDEMKAQFNQGKLFAYGGTVGALLLSATSVGLFAWSANTQSSTVSLTPHAHGVMSAWSWRW